MLHAAASSPARRTTAMRLNELVTRYGWSLTRRGGAASPTTFYHYRSTLLRLGALRREGPELCVNEEDSNVRALLNQPVPGNGAALNYTAKENFAALVLGNADCRSVFFGFFMSSHGAPSSVAEFCRDGRPVLWTRRGATNARYVVFRNPSSAHTVKYFTPASLAAVLYGIRYWARNELGLIDEYSASPDGWMTMFPVQVGVVGAGQGKVPPMVRILLGARGPGEWTLFSISELIASHCRDRRQPISALYNAIDWLTRTWRDKVIVIPTSRAMATLTAISPQQENLVLKRYYKTPSGVYISHFRLHASITDEEPPLTYHADTSQLAEAHA